MLALSAARSSRFWRDRPTLVTGGTGLVGAWLVRHLVEQGADVVCVVRDWVPQSEIVRAALIERVRVVRGDVRDQSLVERALGEYEVDCVLHLAAQTIVGIANRNPVSTLCSNVEGTWSVLEACRRSPSVRRIVVASSDKAYGSADSLPYTEDTPLRGRHPYDVSKACADLIAQSFAATFGSPIVIARCANFFGGGDLNWSRLVPGTIRSVLRAERPVVRSDGALIRDYMYVEDGAAAYALLAEKLADAPELAGQAFNFSNERPMTVLEVVDRVLGLMDSGLRPDVRDEVHHEISEQRLCAAKAREMLGWRPLFDLDQGLARTIDWYRSFLGSEARGRA